MAVASEADSSGSEADGTAGIEPGCDAFPLRNPGCHLGHFRIPNTARAPILVDTLGCWQGPVRTMQLIRPAYATNESDSSLPPPPTTRARQQRTMAGNVFERAQREDSFFRWQNAAANARTGFLRG